MYSYENELQNLKNAQIERDKANLQATRDQTLNDLATEEANTRNNYAQQKNSANVQSKLAAKNFQEYLANTGRANSGIGAQYNMLSNANRMSNLNTLNKAQNMSLSDIDRQRTLANNAYNTGIYSATQAAEADYINRLLQQRQQEFENNMAMRNYYANFSSGGSRGRDSGRSTGNGTESDGFEDSPEVEVGNYAADVVNNAVKNVGNVVGTALGGKTSKGTNQYSQPIGPTAPKNTKTNGLSTATNNLLNKLKLTVR